MSDRCPGKSNAYQASEDQFPVTVNEVASLNKSRVTFTATYVNASLISHREILKTNNFSHSLLLIYLKRRAFIHASVLCEGAK